MMDTKANKRVEEIVDKVHREASEGLIEDFHKFLGEMRDKHIGCILPEIVIAEYCCHRYTEKARDKAVVRFEPKED